MKRKDIDNDSEVAILNSIKEKREARRLYKLSLAVPEIVRYLENMGCNPGGQYHGYWIGKNRFLEVITGLKQYFNSCITKTQYPSMEAYQYFISCCRINYDKPDDISIIHDIYESPLPDRKDRFERSNLPFDSSIVQ